MPSHVGFKLVLDDEPAGADDATESGVEPAAVTPTDAGPPRLAPLDRGAIAPSSSASCSRGSTSAGPLGEANIFTTLVRAPELFRRWLPFGGALLRGALPARDRELLILRTAVNCDAPYEWGQHVRLGRAARGSPTTRSRRVADGAGGRRVDGGRRDAARRRRRAARDVGHSPTTRYAALAARYDEVQLIEVPMVVGHYHLVAMTLNALRVANDDGLAPLIG